MSSEKVSTSLARLEELEEGTRAAPKDSELCLTLGEAFLRVNRVDDAAASYQRAVELDPRSDLRALYWEWLGLVREMEGRLEEALEAYFQWLDADPVAVGPLDRLGTLLVVLGRWTDLLLLAPHFESRADASLHPHIKESFALYTFVTQQFDPVEDDYCKEMTLAALEMDPDSVAMRFLLGLLCYREGSTDLARGEFERVLELDRESLWHESRFALDWSASKARVMVARIARDQGDIETALELLTEASDLERSDDEGLVEVAELLVENGRYDEVLKLTDQIQDGPPILRRLKAESLLGRGRLDEADEIMREEANFAGDHGESQQTDVDSISHRLLKLWDRYRSGEVVGPALTGLRREAPELVEEDPVGASLLLLQRLDRGTLDATGADRAVQELCALFPDEERVWETARQVYEKTGRGETAQLAALTASKLRHGSRPGPTGAYTIARTAGTRILVGLHSSRGMLLLKLEADRGTSETDQIYGWGRKALLPGLELARGVLVKLIEESPHLDGDQLPKTVQVMVTPLLVPAGLEATFLDDGELGGIPLGFLVALLSLLCEPSSKRIAVIGRLRLRGDVDGVAELGEILRALHQSGEEWDSMILAEAGGFRLLRVPAWLWQKKKIILIRSASEMVDWCGETGDERVIWSE